jgi:hypothetical protein
MPLSNDHNREVVEQAAALARELGPELGSMLLTHYPDAETLDTLRPNSAPLETVAAVNRAVATELVGLGVTVFVQVADRAAFRRWMDGREDTPANRLAWRNRDGLLTGAAAMEVLGLDPKMAPDHAGAAKSAGSPADRLMRAFVEDEGTGFDELLNEFLNTGRDGIIELAGRKIGERYGEEAAQDFATDLAAAAGIAQIGPAGWAELVALPVALPPGTPPDAASLGASLIASGALPDTLEVRFLPEWRAPEALAKLAPSAVRRVLRDIVDGRAPADLPPAAIRQLDDQGFGLLIGAQFDWSLPVWEDISENGLPRELAEGEQTPEDLALVESFERWRGTMFDVGDGCVPLGLVPISEVEAEIADFLEEAGEQTGGIQDIRDFVDMARREAPDEDIVCLPKISGENLELVLYTRSGRFLDSLELTAAQLPAAATEMPRLIEAFVPLVREPPSR